MRDGSDDEFVRLFYDHDARLVKLARLLGADDHEDRRSVIDALHALPERKREALVLRYWADLPLAEIAAVMGIRVGTVKSTLSRGLEDLAAHLGEEL